MKKAISISMLILVSTVSMAEMNLLSKQNQLTPANLPENNSNFTGQVYHDHNCVMPTEVYKPVIEGEERTNKMIRAYNEEIEIYNEDIKKFTMDAKQYVSCVKLFVDRGQNDIKTIKTKIDSAISEANGFVEKYQK
mgnify:CR=1 FL=1